MKREDIYKKILNEYENQRKKAEYDLEYRKCKLASRIPELSDIENQLRELNAKMARSLFSLSSDSINVLKAKRDELKKRRNELLVSNGFSEKDLEIKYSCPICSDTGFVPNTAPAQKCSCFVKRISEEYYALSNMDRLVGTQNFKNFNASLFSDKPFVSDQTAGKTYIPREKILAHKAACEKFAAEFTPGNGKNILLYGTCGTGKTYLSSCIARAVMDRGFSVYYTSAYDLSIIYDRNRFGRLTEDEKDTFDYITSCDLLIIDDLGTECLTSFTVSDIFNCINTRLLNGSPVIISTNLDFNNLTERYGERLSSRLLGSCLYMRLLGPDIRTNSALRNNQT